MLWACLHSRGYSGMAAVSNVDTAYSKGSGFSCHCRDSTSLSGNISVNQNILPAAYPRYSKGQIGIVMALTGGFFIPLNDEAMSI